MSCTIFQGDCIDVMRRMDADSVDCVVTSPPYWGLRDYGVAGQMGLEPTLGEHLEIMVAVFEEVRRILKPSGTVWLNYGDCYATTPNGRSAAATKAAGGDDRTFRDKPFSTVGPIYNDNKRAGHGSQRWRIGANVPSCGFLKAKDLCMIPNRLAIALQEAGWWVRSEIIWAKPNPMPESVRDRPATAHEKIFLLTKSARYFYDAEAVRLQRKTESDGKMPDGWDTGPGAHGTFHRNGREKGKKTEKKRASTPRHVGHIQHTKLDETPRGNGRNLLNVWDIAPKPFSEAHFATFPPELAERCIKAGCPPDGIVFDPFGGAGTTALAALRLQRDCTLIELNPDYNDIAARRIRNDAPLITDVRIVPFSEMEGGAGC